MLADAIKRARTPPQVFVTMSGVVSTTGILADAIKRGRTPPQVFVTMSGVGKYNRHTG